MLSNKLALGTFFMAVFVNLKIVNVNLSDYSKPQFSERKKNIAMTYSKAE